MPLLVLGEAEGVLPRRAESRPVEEARARVHDVHHRRGAPPGRSWRWPATPWPKTLLPELMPMPRADRPVDDQHHRRAPGAARRARGRRNPGGTGRGWRRRRRADTPDRHPASTALMATFSATTTTLRSAISPDHLVGAKTAAGEHLVDGFLGGRDDGQPVGPAAGVVGLDQLGGIALDLRHSAQHTPAADALAVRARKRRIGARSRAPALASCQESPGPPRRRDCSATTFRSSRRCARAGRSPSRARDRCPPAGSAR